MPIGVYKHYSHQGNFKKGKHPSPETEFKEGHKKTPKGKKHWNWKGGKTKHQNGYWLIYKPNHPRARKGYIFEHILVAEKKLGRYLKIKEPVHHINGLRDDNRPENLWIFPNNRSHLIYENNVMATYKKWIQQEYNI
jgi:hypothetical protein